MDLLLSRMPDTVSRGGIILVIVAVSRLIRIIGNIITTTALGWFFIQLGSGNLGEL